MTETQTIDQAGTQSTPETYVVDGVEYTPEQLKELIGKGTDYTKKTQDLARQRKEFEQKETTLNAELAKYEPYKDFLNNLETDTNLSQRVIGTVQSYYQGLQNGGPAPTQQQINTIKQAAETNDSDELRQLVEDMQLEREIEKLQGKYDDFEPDEVLQYAEEHKIPDLEVAYRAMNFDKVQDKAAKKALDDAKKGAQVPKTQTGASGSTPGAAPTKPKTWAEADNAAVAYLRNLRGS